MRCVASVLVGGLNKNVSRKDGKTYRRAILVVQGEDAGSLEASIPHDAAESLAESVDSYTARLCTATLNLRDFKGTLYVDLVGLELVG